MVVRTEGKKHSKGQPPSLQSRPVLSLPRHVSHIETHLGSARKHNLFINSLFSSLPPSTSPSPSVPFWAMARGICSKDRKNVCVCGGGTGGYLYLQTQPEPSVRKACVGWGGPHLIPQAELSAGMSAACMRSCCRNGAERSDNPSLCLQRGCWQKRLCGWKE